MQVLISSLHSGNACESPVACDYELYNVECRECHLGTTVLSEARWLMVSALDLGASGPGSSPGRGQDTLLSQCLSPPRCINGYRRTL